MVCYINVHVRFGVLILKCSVIHWNLRGEMCPVGLPYQISRHTRRGVGGRYYRNHSFPRTSFSPCVNFCTAAYPNSRSTHTPPYPLPTSFPRIFRPRDLRCHEIPLFTSLSTTPRTSSLFRTYARFIETNLDLGSANGLDRDEMKELGNDLWVICDGFDDTNGDEGEDAVDEYGEDEE